MPGLTRPSAAFKRVIIDACLSLNGPTHVGSLGVNRWTFRAGDYPPGVAPFNVNPSGASASAIEVLASGYRVISFNSNGAGRATLECVGPDIGAFPLGRDLAAGAPDIRSSRPLFRYSTFVPIRAPVRGVVDVEFGLVLGNGLLTLLGNDAGAILSSRVGVNGGAWTPRVRLANAGAITDGPSSAVVLDATWHTLGFRYTEGLVPVLQWLIDGREVYRRQGAGALPVSPPGPFNPTSSYRLFVGMATGAGTILQLADIRHQVEEV